MSNHILIIEDDAAIAQVLRLNLECADYTVTVFDNGLAAWNALAADHDYDLALLDMMLPGVDGFTLLPKLQEYGIPVICLTAMNDAQHEVQGLRGGAEDYIAKPFEALELLARVEVALRRRGRGAQVLQYGDIRQDLAAHTVTRGGRPVTLSPKEFELLRVFLQNQDLALSREKLLAMVWGYEFEGETRTVDIHVQRLRHKLGLAGRLVTLPRIGYRLEH